MINKYSVQIKGIKANKYNWNTISVFDNLKEAVKLYNSYKSGCCKRIVKQTIIIKNKVLRYKKY